MNDVCSLTIKDLAQRGRECKHAIDQMLTDFWREFEAIEPALAKKLTESCGSSEFAVLMLIGRFKDQPSFLEELSSKPLSQEDINNLLGLSPKPVTHLKEDAAESERGEMTDVEFEDQASLFNRAERARKQYEQELVGIFRKLKEDDSEVANAALELWEDESHAATYLASSVHALADKSPLEVLANGDRKQILALLFRLERGIFS